MRVAADFREHARGALSGRWGGAVIATFIAGILGADIFLGGSFGLSGILKYSTQNNQTGNTWPDASGSFYVSDLGTYLLYFIGLFTAVIGLAFVVQIVRFVVGSFVSLGLIQYNLNLIDGKEVTLGQIFSKSSLLVKAILLRIRMAIFLFLWSLLLIIPGIIKSYAYSMSGFLLTENPEMRPKEAMEISQKMMKGNKWRLFCLQISFIGWYLLSLLTCGIGLLWLDPYYNAAITAFYDEISRVSFDRESEIVG